MGFTFRRRLWLFAGFCIFSYYGSSIDSFVEQEMGYEYAESHIDLIGALFAAFITCKILSSLFVKRWILAGIRSEAELNKALQYGWVRKYYERRERNRFTA